MTTFDFPTAHRCFGSYTSGQDNEYIGWADAKHEDAMELAEKFIIGWPSRLAKAQVTTNRPGERHQAAAYLPDNQTASSAR
jgi:hypothetical protein